MQNRSRKAPFLATVATGLAGLVGCANTNETVPTVDVIPFPNKIAVNGTLGNQTEAGSAQIRQIRPLPLSEDNTFGAVATVEGQASRGEYNRAEDTSVEATQLDGKISLGLYGSRQNGTYFSFAPTGRYSSVATDGVTEKRIILGLGADALVQTAIGGDRNFLRLSLGGEYLDENTNYERGFSADGNGFRVGAQGMYDLWVNTESETGRRLVERRLALILGGAFSNMDRTIDGTVSNTPVSLDEAEKRYAANAGLLFADNKHGFYVLLGGKATFVDVSRDGNTNNKHSSSTSAGPVVELGFNLRRLFDSDFRDDTWALYLKGQAGYNVNNRTDDEVYGTVGIDLADSVDLAGRIFGFKAR